MIKKEIKRALQSRGFAATTAFGFFLMAAGRLDQTNGYIFDRDEAYLTKFYTSFVFSPLTILWPVTVMFPFVLSYRKERDSGIQMLMVLKSSRGQYRAAKLAAVACSGKLFRELNEKEGVTILLTSHYSEDIQELCRSICYMDLLKAAPGAPSKRNGR